MASTSCADSPLGQWLSQHGGQFHPALKYRTDQLGQSVYAASTIPPHTSVVECPFDLAVTPAVAQRGIARFNLEPHLPDHAALVLYLALHRMVPPEAGLRHGPYVDALPAEDDMRTPLFWSDVEVDFLRGTNLHGATLDRKREWDAECGEIQTWLEAGGVLGGKLFTPELHRYFSTVLSSRAFPSSLIFSSGTQEATPVLFPGVDMLNHCYGRKVSWLSDQVPDGKLKIVLDAGVEREAQAFNNYGAKSTEELILGYGFLTASNPSDLVALKLSLPPPAPTLFAGLATAPSTLLPELLAALFLSELRHFVPRTGVIPPALLAQLRLFLASPEEKETIEATLAQGNRWEEVLGFVGWENELDVLSSLEDMLEHKLALVRSGEDFDGPGIRDDVRAMVVEYRAGQVEILESALRHQQTLMEQTLAAAQDAGVEVDLEDMDPDDELP